MSVEQSSAQLSEVEIQKRANEQLLRKKTMLQMEVAQRLSRLEAAKESQKKGKEVEELDIKDKTTKTTPAQEEMIMKYLTEYSLLFNAIFEKKKIQDMISTDFEGAVEEVCAQILAFKPRFDEVFSEDERKGFMSSRSTDHLAKIQEIVTNPPVLH